MSKIVVGMNSNPAIRPHKIDCGFLNTVLKPAGGAFEPLAGSLRLFRLSGAAKKEDADHQADDSHAVQKTFQATPLPISGPTTNCPADPPAIPNICVAPIKVAACEARKFLVAI